MTDAATPALGPTSLRSGESNINKVPMHYYYNNSAFYLGEVLREAVSYRETCEST